jgi:hypothetical protein
MSDESLAPRLSGDQVLCDLRVPDAEDIADA